MEKLKCVRNNTCLRDHSFIDARSSSADPKDNNLVDFGSGFPWPPRSYTCTFCKRKFRSAQALGGHMNVHRRDRARLRQMASTQSFCSNYNSSLLKLNLHPNPNFSHHFSSSLSPTSTILSSLTSKQPNSSYPCSRLCGKGRENADKKAKNLEIVRWNLEDSLVGESKSDENLDLELRLGCF